MFSIESDNYWRCLYERREKDRKQDHHLCSERKETDRCSPVALSALCDSAPAKLSFHLWHGLAHSS